MLSTQDPRVQQVVKVAGGAGTVVVAGGAAVATILIGTSIISAAVIAFIALVMINFVLPVSVRALALARQKTLTALAETFSEETIRDDERAEGDRIVQLENSYKQTRSQLESAIDELSQSLSTANAEEQAIINPQIDAMRDVIANAESVLTQRKTDFAELQRVNKLYIALGRSALAMQKAGMSERDPQQRQDLETAREAIKNRMRAALAGQTIQKMNNTLAAARPKAALPTSGIVPRRNT